MDWIAVALTKDIPKGTVVPRQVKDTDLAIWCSASGEFHAWGDRCPHRGMRLSHGFVRGETLACIYHGWQYDHTGACAYIPAHPKLTPPKTICAQSYNCVEEHGVVWVALEACATAPPDVAGHVPIRSMELNLEADLAAQGWGADVAPIMLLGGVLDIAVILQPSTAKTCVMHVMARADQDPKAVSRHMEQLRIELEAAA